MHVRTRIRLALARREAATGARLPSGAPRLHPLLPLQRSAGNRAVETLVHAPSLRRALGPGRPHGRARIHTGAAAAAFAEALGAEAFTLGRDVGFARGAWRPETPAGRALLRHELEHVRQAEGAAEPTPEYVPVEDAGSEAERAAGAAERRLTRTDRSPHPPAVRLRRAAIYGLDWEIEHSDVDRGDQTEQLRALVRALTGADAATAAMWVVGLGFLAGGNSALLVRALDFLRDNRGLLPETTAGMIGAAAAFCAGRADTPSALTDDFYRDLLMALLYTAPAGSLVIAHKSGSKFAVPGVGAAEAEFGATGAITSLERPAPPAAGQPIGGGFARPLSLTVGFGTGARFPVTGATEELVRAAGDRISPRLHDAVSSIAEDKYMLRALRSFLLRDGGRLVAAVSGGHYDGKKPPTIIVGVGGGPLDTRATLVHELLHYVFDKTDSVLAEVGSRSYGGADHEAIEAIEARYVIIDLIRSGKPPLHEKVESRFGRFLAGGVDLFPKMKEAIRTNDAASLAAIVAHPSFVTTVIESGLLTPASALEFAGDPERRDAYLLTPDQFRDLAFLWAQNAVIVRRAMETAIAVSERTGKPLADAFATSEWQTEMSAFIRAFVLELQRDPRQGPVALEAKL